MLHDFVFAHRAIHLAIDDHFGRVFIFCLKKPIEKKLDRLQGFPVASNQAPALLGVNLQGGVAALAACFLDLHDKAEITEHGVEKFFSVRAHFTLRDRFPATATFSSVGGGCFWFWYSCRMVKRFCVV